MCAILPDADVVGFALGIPYGHMLGHRGLTHSLCFALILAVMVVRIAFPLVARLSRNWWMLSIHFFLVTASHGVLDAMTNGGLGIAFFAPFENSRYFFPWTPLLVSPIGIKGFFTKYSLGVLWSEFVWIWIPLSLIVMGVLFVKWVKRKLENFEGQTGKYF